MLKTARRTTILSYTKASVPLVTLKRVYIKTKNILRQIFLRLESN